MFSTIKLLGLSFLILLNSLSHANEIDNLKTNSDVNRFLIKRITKKFRFSLPLDDSLKIDTSKFKRNCFFKVDIDENGLTDLIISGYADFLIILDFGKKHYELHSLDLLWHSETELVSFDLSQNPKKIIVKTNLSYESYKLDTLIYKFKSFVEYNPNPLTGFSFDKIKFSANGGGLIQGPEFEMIISEDKSATYKAIAGNREKGEFHGQIPLKEFDELLSILGYIKIDNLHSKYSIDWSDHSTCNIEITYKGKTKTIEDYGEVGTRGLYKLYRKFYKWRKLVEWHEY